MSFVSALIQPGHWPYVAPVILLFCSNLFMTLAWYGHLKFKAVSLVIVVLVSIRRPSSRRSRSDYANRVCGIHRDLFRRAA
jgi:hypothetical protein